MAESGVENAGLITFATEEGERGKKQQQKNRSGRRIRIRKGKKGFRNKEERQIRVLRKGDGLVISGQEQETRLWN